MRKLKKIFREALEFIEEFWYLVLTVIAVVAVLLTVAVFYFTLFNVIKYFLL